MADVVMHLAPDQHWIDRELVGAAYSFYEAKHLAWTGLIGWFGCLNAAGLCTLGSSSGASIRIHAAATQLYKAYQGLPQHCKTAASCCVQDAKPLCCHALVLRSALLLLT